MSALRRLLCRYGFHRPAPGEVWNRGYWFTRCSGCDSDMVRTAAGKWHVPKGQKVIWKPKQQRGRRQEGMPENEDLRSQPARRGETAPEP
jgi:hypothetical protein